MTRQFIFIALAFSAAACAPSPDNPADKDPRAVEAEMDALLKDSGAPTPLQVQTFGQLTQFVGKSYKGSPGGPNEPADIQTWEWALGGTAILIRHAIEDGSYGGDTYVYRDAATGDLVYVYITNAGFRTEGTMTVNADGSYSAVEDVAGHDTISKVRSTSRINDDGTTTTRSEYFQNGEWVDGHSFSYAPTDETLPALKGPPPL